MHLEPYRPKMKKYFPGQAIPMTWDFAEANIFSDSSVLESFRGSLLNGIEAT